MLSIEPMHSVHRDGESQSSVSISVKLTWTHVVSATTPEAVTQLRMGGETKVSEIEASVFVRAQHVLRLKIAVRETHVMARLHSVQDLDERRPDRLVVPLKRLALDDGVVEITAFEVVHDEVDVILLLDDMMECGDVWVPGHGAVVEDLALLEHLELGVALVPERALDGVELRCVLWRGKVPCEIDDAVSTLADNMNKAQFDIIGNESVAKLVGQDGAKGDHWQRRAFVGWLQLEC
jgi:hypothetical protein